MESKWGSGRRFLGYVAPLRSLVQCAISGNWLTPRLITDISAWLSLAVACDSLEKTSDETASRGY